MQGALSESAMHARISRRSEELRASGDELEQLCKTKAPKVRAKRKTADKIVVPE